MLYRICKNCVCDTSDPEIVFDQQGVCNHCHSAQKMLKEIEADKPKLPEIIKQIKKDGQGKKYDVLIGLSGGVDSSTTLHYAVKLGLRPLCFSVDNGWQTPQADENIMRLVETLQVPFYRYTIDLKKFLELQLAFKKSGTANIEVPTDHILMATTYEMASKYGIKWIISGGNVASESVMPKSWGYSAWDLKFIKSIGNPKGLPVCSLLKLNWYWWIKRIKTLYLLDYLDYNRSKAIKFLKKKYSYKSYGEKHCESEFTKWFQEKYLPQFGIDKRRAHYSSLINSGQMTRAIALKKLKGIKLGHRKPVSYSEFPNNLKLYNFISSIVRNFRKYGIIR